MAKRKAAETAAAEPVKTPIEEWPVARLVPYGRNPRKNDGAVGRMAASIREFGFKVPVLARSSGEVVDGHLRLKAALKLSLATVPVMLCDEWTDAQVKSFRLMVNRSVAWADWDDDMLAAELADLKGLGFDLSLTGFEAFEIADLMGTATDAGPPAVPEGRYKEQYGVIVICADAVEQERIYERLMAEGLTCRVVVT